jgi:carboxyl-terminal processing protease
MSARTPASEAVGRRRARTGVAVAAVGLAMFLAGVLVGAGGSRPAEGAAPKPGVLDEAAARIAADAQHPVDRATLERAAIEGMLKALGDRWSAFYTADEYDSFSDALEGRYTGVGLWIRDGEDGTVLVASVQPGSPAAFAGLRAGDQLVSVAGTRVATQTLAQVAAALRGANGSSIVIGFRRAGGTASVTLVRREMPAGDIEIDRLRHDVLRIKISMFSAGVGAQVRAALLDDPAAHSGGVVLDLRDDPGGLVDEAVSVAGAFLDGGTVVSYEQRGVGLRTLVAPLGGDTRTPLVVLVDGGTASAAEIVTGALQDRDRAVVVGSRTYGKGSVQEPTTLSDGSAIELTVGGYLTPSGRAIDGVGIDPDVLVDRTAAPSLAEARALAVLAGLRAALSSTGPG